MKYCNISQYRFHPRYPPYTRYRFRVCMHCDLDLGDMTSVQDHWSRSWHILESWTTIVWNIIEIQHGSEELWPGHGFWVCVHCNLDFEGMTLGQGHDTPLGHGPQLWEILSRSNMAVKSCGADTHFLVCVHCDLDLGGMTLGQGHDTPLGHGQQLCEILSRSNMAVRSFGPDMDFGYVCTVCLTLEIWPWQVMTHPWVMDNNWVKYYLDPTWQLGVMARTRILGMCAL